MYILKAPTGRPATVKLAGRLESGIFCPGISKGSPAELVPISSTSFLLYDILKSVDHFKFPVRFLEKIANSTPEFRTEPIFTMGALGTPAVKGIGFWINKFSDFLS